ncbi:MAG: TOBE domain-containing protein, partial [Paracoccaceae bacterium]|nr:TOBE domain-containing protein [Paracoccaceae bacterium]
TFVIVTHDQEEAMTVASRVAVMDHGQLMQVATPDKLYEYPENIYVAGFIGDVNLIQGKAEPKGEGKYLIHWSEGETALNATTDIEMVNGQDCTVAIRPEKVTISAERPTDAANAVQGKIIDIAYLGNLSTYYVKLANGQMVKAQTANTRRLSRRTFTWEDDVWLSWTATAGVVLKG